MHRMIIYGGNPCSSQSIEGPASRTLQLLWIPFAVLVMGLFAMGMSGCVPYEKSASSEIKGADAFAKGSLPEPKSFGNVLESSYRAADSLARWLHIRGVDIDKPILASSFVNIDNLTKSSTLGRMISEHIASRLAQHGFKIIETKLRHDSIFIRKGNGEFLLSRELMDVGASYKAYALLVGTYAVSDKSVLVSARMVRAMDSSVIAGYDYELLQNDTIRSML